ncbi:hypothetical protein [Rhizobium sp. IY2]|uniref:hypothetical protein n=1 Tax=Rhizobium sp. IY2 TaxID=3397853 RepID=UPI0039DFEA9B
MSLQSLVSIFRDYVVDGVSSSGRNKPKKSEIRTWGAWVESAINAFLANGGLIFSSRAELFADLAHPANSSAWVIGDATVGFNGVYGKIGASGTGSWTRRSDLPFSFIVATDTGAGTPNAIQATTAIPVSSSALVWMAVAVSNTDTTVTVSFNADDPLTILTNSGNGPAAGGLVGGMIVLGIISESTFRLVSDQASAAILAQCETAVFQAQNFADQSAVEAGNAADSALEAANLVEQAEAGFIGFVDGGSYDFGSITEDVTYFDQDWGSVA